MQLEAHQVFVSVTPSFASKWLIPKLPDFSSAHPGIEMNILATEKLSSFQRDGINLTVRQGVQPNTASIETWLLFRQEIIAVAAPGLVNSAELPLGDQALALLPRLIDAHDHWPAFLKGLDLKDHKPKSMLFSHTALTIDAALTGQGAVLVSKFLVERELASGVLVRLSDRFLEGQQDFYLMARREPQRRRAVEAALQWFLSKAASKLASAS